MHLEGIAHWQNVERIKKRRRFKTLHQLLFHLLLHPFDSEGTLLI